MTDKLSDLIKFRDDLTTVVSKFNVDGLTEQLHNVDRLSRETTVSGELQGVIARNQEYISQYQGIIDAYKKIIINTNLAIDEAGDKIISNCTPLTLLELETITAQSPSNNILPDSIRSVLHSYSMMQYPGLVVTPCSEQCIRNMVASDPLYLLGGASGQFEFLQSVVENFPDQYRNRLGLYTDIEQLPMNQFSVILVPDFLIRIPYQNVINYLKIMFRVLRPGGSVIFTFNNCDIHAAAAEAEKQNIIYSSQRRLNKDCTELGYEILEFNNSFVKADEYNFTSWAVIKKPGGLKTSKRAQAQGLVTRK